MVEMQQYREAVSSTKQAVLHKWDKYELRGKLKADLYRCQGDVANKAFVEYVIRDYNSPMVVSTCRTTADMDDRLHQSYPDMD